jgi:molecular chaperone GrpE (heat shock protein)
MNFQAREIAQLRKTLEEERVARKQRQSLPVREVGANVSGGSRRQSAEASVPSRKSSQKEAKERIPRPSSATGETTGKTSLEGNDEQSERRRRYSENSLPGHSRRRRPTTEMTSAFILPDITLHYADSEAHPPARLSESAQRVLNSVARHEGKNCTVCKRLLPNGAHHDHEHADHRETITIPRPVPVSERMPEPSAYNEEPTLRPSQPPALALATVLKSLEDELAHLKMQLVTCQSAYTKHDASLSKRQRKSLSKRIEKLLKEIDTKADQIYALYDVLEGQKQDGHEMTEREVEVTLQSIGIDVHRPTDLTGATDASSRKRADAHDDTEDDDDDELPWEGIESTVEMTGRSVGSRRRN